MVLVKPVNLQGFVESLQQECSKPAYDRAVLLWSRSIVLATTLPNKEGSWVCCKDFAKPCSKTCNRQNSGLLLHGHYK